MRRLLVIVAVVLAAAGCKTEQRGNRDGYVFNYTYHRIVYGERPAP